MTNNSASPVRETLRTHRLLIVNFLIFITCVSLNLTISYFIRLYTDNYIENTYPFNLKINVYSLCVIIVFVTYGIMKFGFLYRYPAASFLILVGSWSNFLERLIHGFVTDYIPIAKIAVINIADLQIWTGILLLNYLIWYKNN